LQPVKLRRRALLVDVPAAAFEPVFVHVEVAGHGMTCSKRLKPRMNTNGPSEAEPQALWSARTCPRFRQATCRRRMRERVQHARAAGRGPALATSRQSGKSGDKSPHSKLLAVCAQSLIMTVSHPLLPCRGALGAALPFSP